jgi:8-oxo-dGTP pyrophosphatase MutT (NUDIX family)
MVCRSEQVQHMGGMWVFPGGRVDPVDRVNASDSLQAALNAAIRETAEEAGLQVAAEQLLYLSHWTTPEQAKKRFATWFFAAVLDDGQEVLVDGGEIARHRWVRPQDAIGELEAGELRLMPPTYVTLLELLPHEDCAALVASLSAQEPWVYEPCITELNGVFHFLYQGDAGYVDADPALAGPRHRCIMRDGQLDYVRDL